MKEVELVSEQLAASVDFSRWTVLAVLAPAFKRAAYGEKGVVGTDDLLFEYSRRIGPKSGALGKLRKSGQGQREPGSVSEGIPLKREGDVASTLYEAQAILREVAVEAETSRLGRQPVKWPIWTDGVLVALADAQSSSVAAGLPWVGDREVLVALLSREGNRASRLLARSGLDRLAILAEVEQRQPFEGKGRPWLPAVESLEMVGLVPTNAIVRFLMWPVRKAEKKTGGRDAGLLVVLEKEAVRQAVRTGHDEVLFEHVVLALASVAHQLGIGGIAESEGVRGLGIMLERRNISYVALRHRLAGSAAGLPPSRRSQLEKGVLANRPPGVSAEVSAVLGELQQAVADGQSFVPAIESVLEDARGAAAIAAMNGSRED